MTRCYVQVIKGQLSLYNMGVLECPAQNFEVGDILELYSNDERMSYKWRLALDKELINNPYFNITEGLFTIFYIHTIDDLFKDGYIIDITNSINRDVKIKEVLS